MKNFKQTCDKPYDRHFYTVNRPNQSTLTFDDYELMRAWWFQQMDTSNATVTVMDISQYDTSGKGFG